MQKSINVNGNTTYSPKVPTYRQPVIVDQFLDDNLELNYVLASGNTTLANRYDSMWNPKPGIVNMKAKDGNPDKRRITY